MKKIKLLPAKQINGKENDTSEKKHKDLITAAIDKQKEKKAKFNT